MAVFLKAVIFLLVFSFQVNAQEEENDTLKALQQKYPILKSIELGTYRFPVPTPKGSAYSEKEMLAVLETELEKLKILYIQTALDQFEYRDFLKEFLREYPKKHWNESWKDIVDLSSYILKKVEIDKKSSNDLPIQKNMKANIAVLEEEVAELEEYVSVYYPDPKYYDLSIDSVNAVHLNDDGIIDLVYTYQPSWDMAPRGWWGKMLPEITFLKISSEQKGYRTVELSYSQQRTSTEIIPLPWISNDSELFLVHNYGDILGTRYYGYYNFYKISFENKYKSTVERIAHFDFNRKNKEVNPTYDPEKYNDADRYLQYKIRDRDKEKIETVKKSDLKKNVPENLGHFKTSTENRYISDFLDKNPDKKELLKKYWFNYMIVKKGAKERLP